MKRYVLSLLFVLQFFVVQAQEVQNNEGGSWFTVVNKFKFSERVSAVSVVQWRFVERLKYTRIFLVMPFINYKFSNKISAGVGYNYSNYSIAGIHPPSLDYENRIWQHVTLFSALGKVKMNQRFMFEERFKTKLNNEEAYANRFRYRMNFDFNILKFKNNNYLLGNLSEEIRIRFTEGIGDPNFDQNNFVVSLGYQLLDNSKLYIGYRHDYYNAGNGVYWADNVFNVVYNYNFDFTKKKFYK
ncbi:Protein of unknown function [Lutibacter agarilyticus]|uniref:DUF2490 domain-containing protein n=1 Tax=Lutibacter agarilyticus TaxID=1109740 RepID=A0A238XAV8_9FLAO|nr:DUF2490 domain-containing protein [Lutibacter agarilyticus]SNR55752.1 Protein of unknown function [Lutibacter agarilyticus]